MAAPSTPRAPRRDLTQENIDKLFGVRRAPQEGKASKGAGKRSERVKRVTAVKGKASATEKGKASPC